MPDEKAKFTHLVSKSQQTTTI